MSRFDPRELEQALPVVAMRRLGDARLPTVLAEGERSVSGRFVADPAAGSAGAEASLSLHLFNAADDVDPDGILGHEAKPPDPTRWNGGWRALLAWSPERAWLRYAFELSTALDARVTLGSAAGPLAAERRLRLLVYRHHEPDQRLLAAVTNDLAALPSPFDVAGLSRLQPGEAVALQLRGALRCRIELRWADLLSEGLAPIERLLGAGRAELLMLRVDRSARLALSVAVEDDFTLGFARLPDGRTRVALRVSAEHDRRFAASARISARLADPDAAREAAAGTLLALLDVPRETLQRLRDAVTPRVDDPELEPLVTRLAARLGLDAAAARLDAVLERIDAIESRLTATLDELLQSRASAAFAYDYRRLGSEASLYQASVDPAALSRLLPALLDFDLEAVQADDGPGIAPELFLHERSERRESVLGFSLGLGKWLNIATRRERELRFVERVYRDPQRQRRTLALLAATETRARFNERDCRHGASLKADLAEAREAGSEASRDFEVGLRLWWDEHPVRLPRDGARLVDDARLWGVVDAAHAEVLQQRLEAALADGATVRARLSLVLEDAALSSACHRIALAADSALADAAARALPFSKLDPLRRDPDRRAEAYAPVFARWAKRPGLAGSELRRTVADALRGRAPKSLLAREQDGRTPWTLARTVADAGCEGERLWQRWARARDGAAGLRRLVEGSGDWHEFARHAEALGAMTGSAWLLRVLVALADDPAAAARPVASLRLDVEDGGGRDTILIGGSRRVRRFAP